MSGNNKILLNTILRISDLGNTKVKFNLNNGENDPIELYANNKELINNQWLFWRNKTRYFNVGQTAICLVRINNELWLLTTVKKVTKEFGVEKGINYEGEEFKEYSSLYGRVIVKYKKSFQTSAVYAENVIDELEVVQILPSIFDGEDFPGYDSVRLSFNKLETIIEDYKKDWYKALENQKAVYLITDKSNGKQYVGSATGENGMLLQRWKNYVSNGHGGNKELINIVKEKGIEYVKKNFVYSILENYNARVDKKIILKRESWWKETLGTREFGYNSN